MTDERYNKIQLTLGIIATICVLAIPIPQAIHWYQHLTQTQQMIIVDSAGGGALIGLVFGCMACYDKGVRGSMSVGGVLCAIILWRMGVLASISFAVCFTITHFIIFLPIFLIRKRRTHRNDQTTAIVG